MRYRRYGWGAVEFSRSTGGNPGAFLQGAGLWGILPGERQTVPAAEFFAAIRVFNHELRRPTARKAVLLTDCAYVAKFSRLNREISVKNCNGHLWSQFWELLDSLREKVGDMEASRIFP